MEMITTKHGVLDYLNKNLKAWPNAQTKTSDLIKLPTGWSWTIDSAEFWNYCPDKGIDANYVYITCDQSDSGQNHIRRSDFDKYVKFKPVKVQIDSREDMLNWLADQISEWPAPVSEQDWQPFCALPNGWQWIAERHQETSYTMSHYAVAGPNRMRISKEHWAKEREVYLHIFTWMKNKITSWPKNLNGMIFGAPVPPAPWFWLPTRDKHGAMEIVLKNKISQSMIHEATHFILNPKVGPVSVEEAAKKKGMEAYPHDAGLVKAAQKVHIDLGLVDVRISNMAELEDEIKQTFKLPETLLGQDPNPDCELHENCRGKFRSDEETMKAGFTTEIKITGPENFENYMSSIEALDKLREKIKEAVELSKPKQEFNDTSHEIDDEWPFEHTEDETDLYASLRAILDEAFDQAATGKGAERHGRGNPFDEQHMQTISRMLQSERGMAFQAIKKLTEGLDLQTHQARRRELLGAIVYIAGIIVYWDKSENG